MKLLKIYCMLTLLLATTTLFAQNKAMVYDRSSLSRLMIFHEEDEFSKPIFEAFDSIPCPDKYDNHDVLSKVILNKNFTGLLRKGKNGLIKANYGKILSKKDIRKNGEAIEKMLNDAHFANFMIAKWFGLLDTTYTEAVCNTKLIESRGQYNATSTDVELARKSVRGIAQLSDAGEKLISNSYVLVNDMTYVTAEEKAAVAKAVIGVLGQLTDALLGTSIGSTMSTASNAIADSYTGFTVKTNSYLFRLNWNDTIAANFYSKYYFSEPDTIKFQSLLNDTSFKIEFVAHEYELNTKSALKGKYDRRELVKTVCTRSMDKNIAALQLKYQDFKVKEPIFETVLDDRGKRNLYKVKIGLKEGITEKSKFQVVQKVLDPETNKVKYKYVATVVPEKKKIWDNRYMAVEEEESGAELDATYFIKKSGGQILPGMLVIEGKYVAEK